MSSRRSLPLSVLPRLLVELLPSSPRCIFCLLFFLPLFHCLTTLLPTPFLSRTYFTCNFVFIMLPQYLCSLSHSHIPYTPPCVNHPHSLSLVPTPHPKLLTHFVRPTNPSTDTNPLACTAQLPCSSPLPLFISCSSFALALKLSPLLHAIDNKRPPHFLTLFF